MKIVIINGSSRIGSVNQSLINYLQEVNSQLNIEFFDISTLPLFQDRETTHLQSVNEWRSTMQLSEGLIITSPEYLANIPAALKNALEWLNTDSLLADKKVLPIIFTPKQPRGEKAMQALLWSLKSLHAQILPSISLYHNDFTSVNESLQANTETLEILQASLEYFSSSS